MSRPIGTAVTVCSPCKRPYITAIFAINTECSHQEARSCYLTHRRCVRSLDLTRSLRLPRSPMSKFAFYGYIPRGYPFERDASEINSVRLLPVNNVAIAVFTTHVVKITTRYCDGCTSRIHRRHRQTCYS